VKKGDKKIINAWAVYDWANSVYSLTITTAVFPIYYAAVTSSSGTDLVSFLGFTLKNTVLYSYALSFSFLAVALISPALSGIADYSGRKKSFMKFFCYTGATGCALLYFFRDPGDLYIGIGAFILAGIGFGGSIVFYNAFLPEIAEAKDQDRVSAKGFSLGYAGSSILLIVNLVMTLKPELFGIPSAAEASRISFVTVALWWIGFAQITFYYLPETRHVKEKTRGIISEGYRELRKVFAQLKETPRLKRFLLSFFIYNMAVQTVMYLATLFGSKELKLEASQLILTVLIIQFVAIGGAWGFSRLSDAYGNLRALSAALFIWIGVCIGAYYVYNATGFYAVAFVVGLVMGGIQSLSRSTYSKLLPETYDHASYFSFYDVCDKVGTVLGSAMYGFIEQLTGSMRNSVIALISFFLLGFILLLRIPSGQGRLKPTENANVL
jgi:MFS transporter, UMF1 family